MFKQGFKKRKHLEGKSSLKPLARLLQGLISLDNNYTKQYNYNDNFKVHHLTSLSEVKFSLEVAPSRLTSFKLYPKTTYLKLFKTKGF